MIKRAGPILWAIMGIVALLISQATFLTYESVSNASAYSEPVVADAESAASETVLETAPSGPPAAPLPDLPPPTNHCAIVIRGTPLTKQPPPGYPDYAIGQPWWGLNNIGGESYLECVNVDGTYVGGSPDACEVHRNPGEQLLYFMSMENISGDCGPEDIFTDPMFVFAADQEYKIPPITETTPNQVAPGELAYTIVDYVIPIDIALDPGQSYFTIPLWGGAEAELWAVPGGPPDLPNDVVDNDADKVFIDGPAFDVESFTVNPTSGAPGDAITFTLTIHNSRPVLSTITGVNVVSDDPTNKAIFEATCHDPTFSKGNWKTGGVPIANLAPGESATCQFSGNVPPDIVGTEYRLVGDISVTDGVASRDFLLEDVASDPVTIDQPDVGISKRVLQIQRGVQIIYDATGSPPYPPLEPAAAGDIIAYEIVVENTGQLDLNHVWVVDSLTGVVPTNQNQVLVPAETLVLQTSYTVSSQSQDPLNNNVTVTADSVVTPVRSVDAQASAVVDIIDSALEIDLEVFDALTGNPISKVTPPATVEYQLTLRNGGGTDITNLEYVALGFPLQTIGTPSPISPTTLGVGGVLTLPRWTYAVNPGETDPLVSTIRVRGIVDGTEVLYSQDQVTLDISTPGINIDVQVVEPLTDAVLRGGDVIYDITVTNTDGASALCNVVVNQYLRDPDTGTETPIVLGLPMSFPTTPGQLNPGEQATGSTSYLVTAADKDPLDMIFSVSSDSNCVNPVNPPLSDRTSVVLDISDAQVNAEIVPNLGPDGVAVVGDLNVEFTYVAQNVSAVTLENLSATWCVLHLEGSGFCPKQFDPGQELFPSLAIGSFESTSGKFTYPEILASDALANPFIVEVTLVGTDNKGNEVSIKTAKVIPIASPDIRLDLTAQSFSVIGDTIDVGYTITNTSGTTLSNVSLYNLLMPLPGGGYEEVASYSTILGDAGQNVVTGSFAYTIDPSRGIKDDVLALTARVEGESLAGPVLAVDTVEIGLIPILEVLKTGDELAVAGEAVNYTILIVNNSEDQNVTVTSYADSVLESYGLGPFTATDFATWDVSPGILGPGDSVRGNFQIPSVNPTPNPLVNVFEVGGTREYDDAQVYGADFHELDIGCPIDVRFGVRNLDNEPDNILGEWYRWQITLANRSQGELTISGINESLFWEGLVTPLDTGMIWPDPAKVGVLGPGQSAVMLFPPSLNNYVDIQDNADTVPGDSFTDTVSVEFSGAVVTECDEIFNYPVYSPILVTKIPSVGFAFVGEEIAYTIILENLAEEDDAPYDNYLVTAYDPILEPNPLEFEYSPGLFSTTGWMEPREFISIAVPYVIRAGDVPKLINTVTAEFPDPDPTTADVTWFTSGSAEIGVGTPFALTKIPSTPLAVPGTVITYDYTITNISSYVITGISATDDKVGDLLPAGTLTLNPGETYTELIGIPYDIPIDSPNPVTNIMTVTGTIQGREVSQEVTVSVPLVQSEIEVTKFLRYHTQQPPPLDLGGEIPETRDPDGNPQVDSGTAVHYCFEVKNNGVAPTAVDDIQIEDIMFTGVQEVFEQTVIDWWAHDANSDMLIGGESVEFCLGRFVLTISSGQDPFVNFVTVDGISSEGGGLPVHAEDTLSVDIIGTDLIVTKEPSPSLAFVGDTVTYTISLRNNVADNIIVSDVLDTRENGSPVPIPLDAFTGWSITPGTLAPGETVTYVYQYVLQSTDPDPLVNIATANGTIEGSGAEVFDSARAVVAVTESRLLVDKRATPDVSPPSPNGCEVKDGLGDDPGVPACQMISYRVTITNVSATPDTVYNIYADDVHFDAETVLPTSVRFQGSDLSDTSLDPYETAVIVYDLPAPTEEQLLANPDLDPFINTITVHGTIDNINGIPLVDIEQADSTESVDILQPNVRVTKTPQFGAAAPGQDVPYTVSIANLGDTGETLTSIRLNDLYYDPDTGTPVNLLPELNLDTVCPNIDPAICPFIYGPEPYIDRNGTPESLEPNPLDGQPYDPNHGLESGERITGTITAPVPNPWTTSEFTNVVQIDALAAPAGTAVLDRASATIDIRSAGINVEKTASVSTASIGTDVTYTVRVTNVGIQDIDELILADAGLSQTDDLLDGTVDGAIHFPNATYPAPFDASGDPALLEPDEDFEFQYTHTISAQDADPYVNEVTVFGFTGTGSVINVDQAVVDILGASIEVEKYVCIGDDTADDNDPTTFLPGCDPMTTPVPVLNLTDPPPHRLTYYLHITNPGSLPVYDIAVTDTVGTVPAIAWPYTDGNGTGLNGTDVAPGGDDEIWVMYLYDVQPGDPDPLTNLVTVSGTPETGETVQDTATANVNIVTGDLQLTKVADVVQAQVGDTVTYTLTVENLNATNNITSVSIVDPLSGSATAICTYPTLLPGAINAQTCIFAHTITAADAAPLVNTATATGTLSAAVIADSASATVEIVSSGLLVTKTADTNIASIGDLVTFTYRIENTGTTSITNLVVSESDPGLTFPVSPVPNAWPQFLTPGQVEVRTLARTMQATDPDPYTNTVTVTGVDALSQPILVQATETVTIANGDLVVSNTPSATFALPGQDVTFTYVATNLGTETITGLTITDNRAETACPDFGPVDLGAGLSQTVYCTVTAALPGPIVSTVYAEGTVSGPITLFDTATASVDVTAGGLLVTKTPDMTVASPTDTITFTVEITNIGNVPLTNFNVVDTMYTLSPPVPGDTLNPGATHTMTGSYTVPAVSPPSSLTNTVTVTADDVTPPTTTTYEDSDTAVVAILDGTGAGDLVLTKSVTPLQALPGQTVTYSFMVQNIGTSALTGIQLNDANFAYATPAIPTQPVVDLPDLAPGNVWNGSFDIVIPADWTDTTFVNTAEVYSGVGAPILQDTASVTVDVELVTVEKVAGVGVVPPGVEVTYTFTLTNNSTAALSNVSLIDPLITSWTAPAPFTDGAMTGIGVLSFTGSLIVPGGSLTFDNTASVEVGGVEVSTDTESVVVAAPDPLVLTKTADPATATAGTTITYTFTIDNPNAFDIVNVSLLDPIIDTYGAWDAPGPLTDGAVPASGQVVITGTAKIPVDYVGDTFDNTASVEVGGVEDATDTMSVIIGDPPTLTKTANLATAQPGTEITYTFTIDNPNDFDIPNATLDDPGITTWVSGALTDGDIPADGLVITGTATIPDAFVPADWNDPVFSNTASLLLGATEVDTATADVEVEVLTLDKTAVPMAAVAGDTITYIFTVTNYSTATIPNVSLIDPVITTWTTPAPLTAGNVVSGTTTLTGEATIPVDHADPTFDNTASLEVGGVEVATDTVQVSTGDFGLTIDGITQPGSVQPLLGDDPDDLAVDETIEPLQTGEPITLTFTIENFSANVISGLTYGVFDDALGQSVNCQLLASTPMPATLQPAGDPDDLDMATLKCRFTPLAGLPMYKDVGGLLRTVRVDVFGTDEGPTADPGDDEAVESTASVAIELIDLLLDVQLTILSATDNVVNGTLHAMLRVENLGASPVGCTNAVAGTAACHMSVTVNSDPINVALQAAYGTTIANLVLLPDNGINLPEDAYEELLFDIPVAQPLSTDEVMVVADGGFYRADLQTPTDLLPDYVTYSSSPVQPLLGLEVYVTPTPAPPIYDENVTYTVTVLNNTLFTVDGLTGQYNITPLAVAPQMNNGIMLAGNSNSPMQQTWLTLTFNVTSLAPGGATTATLSKIEDNTGTYQFNVSVAGYAFTLPQDATASTSVTITPTGTPGTGGDGDTDTGDDPPLSDTETLPQVTKTADTDTTQPGERVVWTIRVRNGWTSNMPNVVVQDEVPSSLVIDSASTDRGVSEVSGQLVTISAGTLAPDEDVNITIYTTTRDDAPSPGTIVNSACATYDGGNQDCGSAEVSVGPGVGGLPDTGVRTNGIAGDMGIPGFLGIALVGALMLLMAAQSERRMVIAMVFVVIVIAVAVVGVAVLLMGGGDDAADPTDEAEVPFDQTPGVETGPDTAPEVVVEFPPTPTPYEVSAPAVMPYLLIPKLGAQFEVPVPIVDLPIVNREWDVSGLGYYVGWLQGTTWMDPVWGNTVLAAHVQLGFDNPGPFWGLGELLPGDEIVIVEGDVEHRFVVTEITTVDPGDWTVTAPTDDPMLTLITCTNWDQSYGVFAERMVVRAVPSGMADPAGAVQSAG